MTIFNKIAHNVQHTVEGVIHDPKHAVSTIQHHGQQALDDIGHSADQAADNVVDFGNNILHKIESAGDSAIHSIDSKGKSAVHDVEHAGKDFVHQLKEQAEQAGDALTHIDDLLESAFLDFAGKFAEGFSHKALSLTHSGVGIWRHSMAGFAKKFPDIASNIDKVGFNLDLNVAQGYYDGFYERSEDVLVVIYDMTQE